MARYNYLIEGLAGTGKTAVCQELAKRGYNAIDADQEFGYFEDPQTKLSLDKKTPLTWKWNKDKLAKALLDKDVEAVYICGGSMNQNEFEQMFTRVFTLTIDDDTLKQRLLSRKNSLFGKHPEDLAQQLEWNKGTIEYARQRNAVIIDATEPLNKVVDEILKATLL